MSILKEINTAFPSDIRDPVRINWMDGWMVNGRMIDGGWMGWGLMNNRYCEIHVLLPQSQQGKKYILIKISSVNA